MDPNANLAEQRQIIAALLADGEYGAYGNSDDAMDAAIRLAELANAMDEWLRTAGFLPAAWMGHRPVHTYADLMAGRWPAMARFEYVGGIDD